MARRTVPTTAEDLRKTRRMLERERELEQRPVTPMRIKRFIEAIRTGSEPPEAAEFAGVKLGHMRSLRRTDVNMAAMWTQAEDESGDHLVQEARRRAIDGWEEPIVYRGEVIGHKRVYSDRLLELLLKARVPAFADKQKLEISGQVTLTADDLVRARSLPKSVGVDVLESIAIAMREHEDNPPLELEAGAVRDAA